MKLLYNDPERTRREFFLSLIKELKITAFEAEEDVDFREMAIDFGINPMMIGA